MDIEINRSLRAHRDTKTNQIYVIIGGEEIPVDAMTARQIAKSWNDAIGGAFVKLSQNS